MKILSQSHIGLCEAVKLCLILSLGNARVESGFSVNSEITENNPKESELVSQRMVKIKADISNEMIDYVGRSHRLYQAAQKESKENQILPAKKRLEKKG